LTESACSLKAHPLEMQTVARMFEREAGVSPESMHKRRCLLAYARQVDGKMTYSGEYRREKVRCRISFL